MRYRQHGPNRLRASSEKSAWKLLLRQFASPLILILVAAAVLSLFLQDWLEASLVLVIIFGSTLLGFYQEYRASNAIANLRRRLALKVKAVRNGAPVMLPVSALVPGDVIELSAGNLVPADGVVLQAKDFLVNEANLTGESFPVEKRPGTVTADAPLQARANCIFLGTSVRSGFAKAVVVTTGSRTAFGAVALRLGETEPETEFARGIRQFGYLLIRVVIVLVVFVLVANHMLGRPPIESVLFAAALAVGMSPELLPAIISVTLSAGARNMAHGGVIVRRLEAIENLGSIDILCVDKTGTLTEGVLDLAGALDAEGLESADVRRLAFINASFETGIENPLDAAIVASGKRSQLTTEGYHKVDEIPYDFIRKRLTIVVTDPEDPERHWMITKGAVDTVLAICSTVRRDTEDVPFDVAARSKVSDLYKRQGKDGYRVLAVASKRCPAKERYCRDDEEAMSCVGLLLFSDPPKPGVEKAIADLASMGIRIKVISGDNRFVSAHLAERVGLNASAMLTGQQIENLKDEALWRLAGETDLFVEADPQQKERIIRALQHTGHAVGFLGDGINDAPALRAADVGISVDQAVDVARETADIVLLRHDLDVLRRGVEDGRRTVSNTLKYICITTSANFGNMVSMALATPFLPFLPLAAKQILLNNFLSDVPSIAISADNVDKDTLIVPPRWRLRDIKWFMVVFGLISSAFDTLAFLLLLELFAADQAQFQTGWFVVSLWTELAVVLVLRTHGPAIRSMPSRVLLLMTAVVMIVAILLPFGGPLAALFGFVPLSGTMLGSLMLIVAGYVVATESVKLKFFRAASLRA